MLCFWSRILFFLSLEKRFSREKRTRVKNVQYLHVARSAVNRYNRNPRILLISWYVTHFPFPLYTYLFGYVFFVLFMQYTLALDPNTLTTFITLVAAGDLTMVGTSPLCLVLGLTSGLFATKAKDRYLLRDGWTRGERSVDNASPIHSPSCRLMKNTFVINSRIWPLSYIERSTRPSS